MESAECVVLSLPQPTRAVRCAGFGGEATQRLPLEKDLPERLRLIVAEPDEASYESWTQQDVHALRGSLLEDACRTVLDTRNGITTRRDAWNWIDSVSGHAFSFIVLARCFGINPTALREELHKRAAALGIDMRGEDALLIDGDVLQEIWSAP